MDNRQIDALLKSSPVTRPFYLGSFSCNTVPVVTKYPSSFVLNLDGTGRDGLHWSAVWVSAPSRIVYFDSFGIGPNECELMSLKRKLGEFNSRRNTRMFQSEGSDACGQYVVYFIYQCSLGWRIDDVVRHLSRTREPDSYVKRFARMIDSYTRYESSLWSALEHPLNSPRPVLVRTHRP